MFISNKRPLKAKEHWAPYKERLCDDFFGHLYFNFYDPYERHVAIKPKMVYCTHWNKRFCLSIPNMKINLAN